MFVVDLNKIKQICKIKRFMNMSEVEDSKTGLLLSETGPPGAMSSTTGMPEERAEIQLTPIQGG